MNTEALFLFLILLLGLILCSFLGGNSYFESFKQNTNSSTNSGTSSNSNTSTSNIFDNYYNHFTNSGSTSQLQTGTVFTDQNGNTVTVIVNSDGTQSLKLIQIGQPIIILTTTPPSGTTATVNTYYAQGPLKMTATVFKGNDGQTAIKFQLAGGQTIYFKQSGDGTNITGNVSSTQYYGSTGSPYQTGASATSYTGPYGGSAGSVTGPGGNTAYYAQGPNGNTAAGSNYDYSNSLPPGIPASQIPSGQEDLYILKSQVVPPVCPICPSCSLSSSSSNNNNPDNAEKCPPCPACARCPEPSFECKKVPNYNATTSSYLPQPVINSFSSFGM